MAMLIAAMGVIAVVVTYWWLLHKASGGRIWSPLWLAFSATTLSAMYLVAGTIGYTLSRHRRFVEGTAWSGRVIWWQVGVGLVLLPVAAFLWRKGLRSTAGD